MPVSAIVRLGAFHADPAEGDVLLEQRERLLGNRAATEPVRERVCPRPQEDPVAVELKHLDAAQPRISDVLGDVTREFTDVLCLLDSRLRIVADVPIGASCLVWKITSACGMTLVSSSTTSPTSDGTKSRRCS